jgi:hypothetical protein
VLFFTGFSGCDRETDRGWSFEGRGGWEGRDAINVDDLGLPTDRPDEVADLEVDIGGGDGETSETTGRVEGVGSFCPTLLEEFGIRIIGPEAGVVKLDETAETVGVDFAVAILAFVIVLSSDPRASSGEKSRSS